MYQELVNALTDKLGHSEANRRIDAYRTEHGCALDEAVATVAAQHSIFVAGQVRCAILVLRAYAAETLQIDSNELVDKLDEAIEAAFGRRMTDIEYGVDCDIDIDPTYEPPQARSA